MQHIYTMSPPTATDNVPASQTGAKEVQKGAPKFKFPKVSTNIPSWPATCHMESIY